MSTAEVIQGDCLEVMRGMDAASVDAIVTDPPYPCIKRSYGYWTEEQWFALINPVVEQCRRVLKPTGSAVFVLQPNYTTAGKMNLWAWKFVIRFAENWGLIQDAYWFQSSLLPNGAVTTKGLMRPGIKHCVWLGMPNAYRNQSAVLRPVSKRTLQRAANGDDVVYASVSGNKADTKRITESTIRRGGSTPFNLFECGYSAKEKESPHPARTPLALCRWWTRYICPPGGMLLDPFAGSGTTGVAAITEGRQYIGIERVPEYVTIARQRIAATQAETPLFAEGNP